MELYDGIIRRTREQLSAYAPRQYLYDKGNCLRETLSGEMIMLREAAFELGGGNCESVNYTCVTSDEELISRNEVLLYGPDLKELHQDTSFARITFLYIEKRATENSAEENSMAENSMAENYATENSAAGNLATDDDAYHFIRNLEYVRYHIYPKGYMVRTSAKSSREQARVSRAAIREGITFEKLGNTYIRKYLQNPMVKHVQVLFLTGQESLAAFREEAKKAEAVTEAMNHILKGMPMNCGSCDLQEICNEVEGMRAMHQKSG